MYRPRISSQLSRSQTSSHKYAVRCPFSVRRIARRAVVAFVEGQKFVPGPANLVVICTSELLTAKCTSAPVGKESKGSTAFCPLGLGWRSKRY